MILLIMQLYHFRLYKIATTRIEFQHNVGYLTMAKCNKFPSVIYDAAQT
jgi:hypothetical protein